MRFKVKDLMISVPSQQQIPQQPFAQIGQCWLWSWLCTFVTCGCTCSNCSGGCTCSGCTCRGCSGCSAACTARPPAVSQIIDPTDVTTEQLAMLKAELQRNLAQVEAQQQVMEQQLRPQTLEDVNLLEQKLQEALEELRARKAELQGATGQSQTDRSPGGPPQG